MKPAPSINSQADIEEERRLAYVAITRAKKKLYISLAAQRMLFDRQAGIFSQDFKGNRP